MFCCLGVKLLSKLDESGSKLGMQGLKLDSSPDIGSKLGESGVEVGSRDKEATSTAGRSWGDTSKNCISIIVIQFQISICASGFMVAKTPNNSLNYFVQQNFIKTQMSFL